MRCSSSDHCTAPVAMSHTQPPTWASDSLSRRRTTLSASAASARLCSVRSQAMADTPTTSPLRLLTGHRSMATGTSTPSLRRPSISNSWTGSPASTQSIAMRASSWRDSGTNDRPGNPTAS